MNNGKICVSLCAETAEETLEQIRRAENFADVIEVRLDYIESKQLHKTLAFLASKKPLLLTYRPQGQGGKATDDLDSRKLFWEVFLRGGFNDSRKRWVDYEYDLINLQKTSNPVTIRSFHDFSGVPENLSEIFENLSAESAVAKIAIRTESVSDSVGVWKLLEKARRENKSIIPIAMGEAGKWTRILGLAHGAFMTYAALETENKTAPGQISARDLVETYRVKELNKETSVYGVIGNPVSHSLSPFIHNAAFKFHNLNAVYIPFEAQNPDEFLRRMVKPATREIDLNFKGFSVTIPHKQAVLKHLDSIDETARKIGAVNTIKIADGKFYGYNTDADAFIEPLLNTYGDLRGAKVAIFGAGGATRACLFALRKAGAEAVIFARNPKAAKSLAEDFAVKVREFRVLNQKYTLENFDIVVNATPLGTIGKLENETPISAEQLKNVKLVYDLVYNPSETQFLKQANSVGVPTIGGLAMLISQAAQQFKIWTEIDAPAELMRQVALQKL